MRITITALLATGLLGLTSNLFAAGQAPDRGMTQDAVRKQFGNPNSQVAPVGNPPISRWVYDDFTVYFEGRFSIHAVQHAKTLTTPSAPVAVPEAAAETIDVVDQLPTIEEVGTPAEVPAASAEPATSAEPEEPAENTFRFDPTTGRIIEVGPDGKAVQSPAAQPSGKKAPEPVPAEAPAPSPAPVEAPAPAKEPVAVEPAKKEKKSKAAAAVAPAAAASPSTSTRFDPATGKMIEVDANGNAIKPVKAQPAAAAPAATQESAPAKVATPSDKAPAAKEPAAVEPATTEAASEAPAEANRFRFDPATGRIVMDEPAAAEQSTAEKASTENAPEEKAVEEKPKKKEASTSQPAASKPAVEKDQQEDSGFSLEW